MRKSRTQKLLVRSTLVIAVAIATTGALTLGAFDRLVVRQAEIERLHAVHGDIVRVRASIFRAEAAYRAFAIAGDEQYLEPYNAAVQDLDTRMQRLASNASLDAAELAEFKQLGIDLDVKQAEFARGIRDGLRGHLQDSTRRVRDGSARASLMSVIERLDRIDLAQETRLNNGQGRYQRMVDGAYILVIGAMLVSLVLLGVLVFRIYRASAWAYEARVELAARNVELGRLLAANDAASRHMHELSALMGYLHACNTTQEALQVLKDRLPALFPGVGGALYEWVSTDGLMQLTVAWGERGHLPVIRADECWGLRRGQPFTQPAGGGVLACKHFHHEVGDPRVEGIECLPMMAHGEIIGLLVLEEGVPSAECDEAERARAHDIRERAVEHVALSLGNLRLRESLREQSIRDPLTGLHNRRFLEEFVEREIIVAARKRADGDHPGFAVLMIDVDHFKKFNDEYGHDIGDLVLCEVARTIQAGTRATDIVARYGGEEFSVVLTDIAPELARERAESLRAAVAGLEPKGPRGFVGRVTVSIGLAHYPHDGACSADLHAAADNALYEAKRGGRNRVHLFRDAA
ncbi:diguanylate cyclase [Aromatoleum petrolei]|uniref:diguanylate cyclase n=1 Tax=Aromatoleum petrolei TaxID=76116 RepID=A0ABX1MG50_9RHOO|nr:diguanylate cyclase [Aromatoleum petrolei]